ncbi:MAG: glycosyltransferase, partial [Candidatus Micrarchaeota archaeon]|nr:glycosyltransferase [Candidatus Micrarchaeota archaeon]
DLFSAQLRKEGHQVRVFAPDGGKAHRRDGAHYAPSLPFPPYPQYRVPVWTQTVARQAADWKPDVIHCHAMLAMGIAARAAAGRGWPGDPLGLAGRGRRVPLVGTFHTMVPSAMHYVTPHKGMQKWAEHLSWGYLRWFYGPFDRIVAPSAHLQRQILERRLASTVVPNPVDTARFRPGKIDPPIARLVGRDGRGKQGEPLRRPAFLYLGRVAEEKNLEHLLQLAGTPEWRDWGARLWIAGGGPYRSALAARAREMGLHGRVRFLGKVGERQLPSLYRAADFTLLPSKFETQGLVALESMACGTPVACLENTALAEVVVPGVSGVRWQEGSGASQCVRELQKGMERRRRLSAGAKKTAARYSVAACTRQLLAVYKEAIGKNRKK